MPAAPGLDQLVVVAALREHVRQLVEVQARRTSAFSALRVLEQRRPVGRAVLALAVGARHPRSMRGELGAPSASVGRGDGLRDGQQVELARDVGRELRRGWVEAPRRA